MFPKEAIDWLAAQPARPRVVLYGQRTEKTLAAQLSAACDILLDATGQGEPALQRIAALPQERYDILFILTPREGIACACHRHLELAGIPVTKIRWLQTAAPRRQTARILVSCRIDVPSVTIPNPVYLPVRCGAHYDHDPHPVLAGDDTGDNVSRYQPYLSELSVQYWGWKNVRADYLGLCHYRRYLSFSDENYETSYREMVMDPALDEGGMERYGLLDAARMTKAICAADGIVNTAADVRRIPTPRGLQPDLRRHWEAHSGVFFPEGAIAQLEGAIAALEPQYLAAARDYFAGHLHRGYNCFVLRRPLYDELCRMQHHILTALFPRFFHQGALRRFPRTCAYLGEMLYGIYIHALQAAGKARIAEHQLVLFGQTGLSAYHEGRSSL